MDTAIDLSYLDSAHPVGQWDPDRAAKLSPTSDNRDKDCVRCVCGMAEDDGVMSQCDRCHFWLHADCMDSPVPEEQKVGDRRGMRRGNRQSGGGGNMRRDGKLHFWEILKDYNLLRPSVKTLQ